jgi:hypothetical protein
MIFNLVYNLKSNFSTWALSTLVVLNAFNVIGCRQNDFVGEIDRASNSSDDSRPNRPNKNPNGTSGNTTDGTSSGDGSVTTEDGQSVPNNDLGTTSGNSQANQNPNGLDTGDGNRSAIPTLQECLTVSPGMALAPYLLGPECRPEMNLIQEARKQSPYNKLNLCYIDFSALAGSSSATAAIMIVKEDKKTPWIGRSPSEIRNAPSMLLLQSSPVVAQFKVTSSTCLTAMRPTVP